MNLIVDWLSGIKESWRFVPTSVILLLASLSSCNTSKILEKNNQELLVKQRFELLDNKNGNLEYELSTLAQQQPNGNFLFVFPREYYYLANSKPKDTTGVDRFLRNTIGQVPAIYNDSLSEVSAKGMQDYLQYHGFFNAEVYYEEDRKKGNKVNLTYFARTGKQTRIKSIHYSSPQPDIDSLLKVAQRESLLKVGGPLDLDLYNNEKERLSRFLRNQGYAFLYNNVFDQLEVDTFGLDNSAEIYLKILPPPDQGDHIRYRTGRVEVYPDFSVPDPSNTQENQLPIQLDTILDGVHFYYHDPSVSVQPETLLDNVFLRPGAYYSKSDFDKTNQQLGALGIFRFVRINQIVDSLEDDLLHYVIQLTPSFKMEVGATVDLNYTNRNTTGADNLIGIALSPSFRNRNLFGGAELLVTSLRAGVEINPTVNSANTRFYNTVDLGAEVSLFLPRFRDITGLYRLAYGKGKRLLTNRFYTSMRERAETRFGIGAEYLLIRGFYDYTQFNARLGYNMRISGTTKYQINHTAVDLLRPNTEPAFDTILMENQFLQRSFGEQFFFSLLFRDIDYQRNGRTNRHGESAAINFNLEVAGAELYAANRIANAINGDNRIFQPLGADYAQYIRTQFDLRYYKEYSETTSLATRFLFNIARPFGFGQAVPYVKQFNAGGANSMRAWSPRGLGPGGFVDSLSLLSRSERSNLLLYQTGDLQLELNLELRYKLFWQLRGALFVDIGNVWTLDYQNEDRRGSQFRFTTLVDNDDGFRHQPFFRQLAIGAGTGIRVDLSYFIFRLDAAIPLRFNYPSERPDNGKLPERLYWNTFKGFRFPGDFTWQLGLGYPF